MDLARSLGASDTDPERPAPEWTLPDDESLSEEADKSAWAAWNSAVVKGDGPAKQRDPREETEFWRSAARDVVAPGDEGTPETVAEQPTRDQPEFVEDAKSSTDIWRMARGVTGQMSRFLERLRTDLENFNPDENTDQYRNIARELVGPPPDEPWDNVEPVRAAEGDVDPEGEADSKQDAEAGSGWNPDVDWMRFEDLRREQARKVEADARREVAREAQEKKREARDALERAGDGVGAVSGQEGVIYTDETGRVLTPEEVEQAKREGALFVDEADAQMDVSKDDDRLADQTSPSKFDSETNSFSDGRVPGFIANKFRSSGTYGSGYVGMEEDMKALQEQGIPLRDPQADAERWRAAAREVNITADEEGNADTGNADAGEGDDILTATPGGETAGVTPTTADVPSSAEGGDADESSSWSSWREGTAKWQRAVETTKPRDPKQEVDMWRSSARELTADEQQSSESETKVANDSNTSESNAWNSWRNANANWESSVLKADTSQLTEQAADNPWGSQDTKSDWGAGLNGKASSDRSAWHDWNKGQGLQAGSSLWWPSKLNSPAKGSLRKNSSGVNNADQWRAAALEVSGLHSNTTPEAEVSNSEDVQSQEMKQDPNIEFWKDLAKGMTTSDEKSNRKETVEGSEED